MLTTPQLAEVLPDLATTVFESALALVHSRFPPTPPVVAARTPLPVPAHNGEINTVQGNRHWMRDPRGVDVRLRSSRASSAPSRITTPPKRRVRHRDIQTSAEMLTSRPPVLARGV